jgi:hypothetical protein
MWKVIFFLWSIPIALGLVMLIRVIRETPAITEHERQLFFGGDTEPHLSPWLGVKIALLSIVLFFAGVLQGLILINIGFPWIFLAPVGTALAVMFILSWWFRSAANKNARTEQEPARLHDRQSRTPNMLPE